MTDNCALALKIDVDTLKGYREGLPRLLDMLKRRGIRTSATLAAIRSRAWGSRWGTS